MDGDSALATLSVGGVVLLAVGATLWLLLRAAGEPHLLVGLAGVALVALVCGYGRSRAATGATPYWAT